MKNHTSYIVLLLIVLILAAGSSFAADKQSSPTYTEPVKKPFTGTVDSQFTPLRDSNTHYEVKTNNTGYQTEICGDNIIVHMGDKTLSVVNKKWRSLRLENGGTIHLCKDKYPNEIYDVRSVVWADFKVIDMRQDKFQVGSSYARKMKYLDKVGIKPTITELSDGLKKFSDRGYWDVYLLPKKLAPTGNSEPVALICRPRKDNDGQLNLLGTCNTSYLHPSGLWLSYDFNRRDIEDENLIDIDKSQRAILENMLVQNVTGDKK